MRRPGQPKHAKLVYIAAGLLLTCHPGTTRLRGSGLLAPRHRMATVACSISASVYSRVAWKRKFSTLPLRSAVENGSFSNAARPWYKLFTIPNMQAYLTVHRKTKAKGRFIRQTTILLCPLTWCVNERTFFQWNYLSWQTASTSNLLRTLRLDRLLLKSGFLLYFFFTDLPSSRAHRTVEGDPLQSTGPGNTSAEFVLVGPA